MKSIFILLLFFSFNSIAELTSGQEIYVPSDQKATYRILRLSGSNGLKIVMTQRDGPSGTSYSSREYDCHANQFRYIGTGDTIKEMKNSVPDKKYSKILNESIAYYIGKTVCK